MKRLAYLSSCLGELIQLNFVSPRLFPDNQIGAKGTQELYVLDSFFFIRNVKSKTALRVGRTRGKPEKNQQRSTTLVVQQYTCSRSLAERKPGSFVLKSKGAITCFQNEIVNKEAIFLMGSAFALKMNTHFKNQRLKPGETASWLRAHILTV